MPDACPAVSVRGCAHLDVVFNSPPRPSNVKLYHTVSRLLRSLPHRPLSRIVKSFGFAVLRPLP
jgi:hypothetical protein